MKKHIYLLQRLALGLVALVLFYAFGCREQASAPAFPESSSPLQVGVATSTNNIYIGDIFSVKLLAVHPADTILSVPPLTQPEKQLVVRDRKQESHLLEDGRQQTLIQYQMTSFRIGTHILSTGLVQCADSEGKVTQVSFPDTRITVHSMLTGKEEEMQDIKGIVSWPGRVPRWIWAFGIIAIITLVIALIIRHFLTKPRTILHAVAPPPPHKIALAALEALKRKGWIESENVEPFYVELSSIARQYLEARYHLRAPEQTTEEFIRDAVNSRKLSTDHQQLLRDFLEQSDLVKFARHHPGQDDMRHAFAAAERLVHDTQHVTKEVGS